MIKWTAITLILGFFIDLLVGDPRWLYHPVRIIGNGISFLEKILRRIFPKTEQGEQNAGLVLVVIVCTFGALVPLGILYPAYHIHVVFGVVLETFMCYQMLATKSLKDESMRVYEELKKGDLKGARYAVSMIVGRDTENLTEEGVTKAAVETVAENTSDGIIAPLFYMAVGGPALMFFYKSINTMDSMVGYKNEKYLNFGRYAAKLDDVVNYIPARISAWLMIAAAYLSGFDGKNAKKSILETDTATQARTQPRLRRLWRVPWMSSLREMRFISENYMKNRPSGMQSVRWNTKISKEQTVCYM